MSASLDDVPDIDIDLSRDGFEVLFTDSALRLSAALNLMRGETIVLHMKYSPLRAGFILNDMVDGSWSAEVFVPCLRPQSSTGMAVTLLMRDDEPQLLFGTGVVIRLGQRFTLHGKLRTLLLPPLRLGHGPARLSASDVQVTQMLSPDAPGFERGHDAIFASASAFFLEGWIDDRRSELVGLSVVDYATGSRAMLPAYRVRRPDVDSHLKPGKPSEFGYWAVGFGGAALLDGAAMSLVFRDGSGLPIQPPAPRQQSEADFLLALLGQFGQRKVLGNLTARSFADLDAGYGEVLAKLYDQMAAERRVVNRACFGTAKTAPRISLVCVLYGLPDFLYLLVSQFARFGGLHGLEFIFVNNSPEIEEVLLRDAELASMVFDANIQVITLNQNCGFSHANNVGVGAANADCIAIINPDVFPRDAAAIDRLRALAETDLGDDIYGGKLYYADGSVMHEGMFFVEDQRLTVLCQRPVWTVEHFRKGFADTASPAVRPVPALTGALQILSRRLFERMGGFSTDFFFGHYEDADLCLRIRQAGGRVLLDPALAYWHYEGMGSIKRPEHVGSGLYNRWFFSGLWGQHLREANDV